ncbi:MAG: hypothetical protein AB6733_12765 [Clostridiaceae bacterium]
MKDNVIVVNFTNKDKNNHKKPIKNNKNKKKPNLFTIIINKIKSLFSNITSRGSRSPYNPQYPNRFKNRYK